MQVSKPHWDCRTACDLFHVVGVVQAVFSDRAKRPYIAACNGAVSQDEIDNSNADAFALLIKGMTDTLATHVREITDGYFRVQDEDDILRAVKFISGQSECKISPDYKEQFVFPCAIYVDYVEGGPAIIRPEPIDLRVNQRMIDYNASAQNHYNDLLDIKVSEHK